MSTTAPDLERLVHEIQVLSPEERIRLVGRIVDSLLPGATPRSRRFLKYGEFFSPHLSGEEDFRIAEWPARGQEIDAP